jgi:hypothetical protein
MLSRTAKSSGPDAPTLASSLAEVLSALPGSDKTLIREMTVAKEPGHRSTTYALKPLRRECRVFRVPCGFYPCAFYLCTGGCGSGHPAFPAPSLRAKQFMHNCASRQGADVRLELAHLKFCESGSFWAL